MGIDFVVSDLISASPEKIYHAWLNSKEHELMTGSPADISDEIDGDFSAWDGYITGKNLELTPDSRILQSWRTTEFADSDPDSLLDITIVSEENATRITIHHSELPEHGMQYQQGWIEAYFNPMKDYFI